MIEKLIFISCGQQTSKEKRLGTSVKKLIDSTSGYKAYFAEYVQNLDALAKNIFDNLRKCSGLISFLHERGRVSYPKNKEWGYRSSVWVNQEIAILAYRKQFEGIDIPILVFKDKKVRLEGAMTSLIVNPIAIASESEVLKQVNSWLNKCEFPLNSSTNDDRFLSKWKSLSSSSRTVIATLLDEGGNNVKESAIRTCLQEKYGFEKNKASQVIHKARREFINTDLVKWKRNKYSGDEMSINPTWKWHIYRNVKNRKKIKQ